MTIRKYLDLLKKSADKEMYLLAEEGGDLRRDPEVPNSVIRTWHMSFNEIQQFCEHATDILSQMSFFDRQSIPDLIFLRDEDTSDNFEEAIETLLGYGFIAMEIDGRNFSMHRLVQLAVQNWLWMSATTELQQELAFQRFAEIYPAHPLADPNIGLSLEPHAQALLKHDGLTEGARLCRAWFQIRRGDFHLYQALHDTALEAAQQAANDCDELLGSEHYLTLAANSLLAFTRDVIDNPVQKKEPPMQMEDLQTRFTRSEYRETMSNAAMAAFRRRYGSEGDEEE